MEHITRNILDDRNATQEIMLLVIGLMSQALRTRNAAVERARYPINERSRLHQGHLHDLGLQHIAPDWQNRLIDNLRLDMVTNDTLISRHRHRHLATRISDLGQSLHVPT